MKTAMTGQLAVRVRDPALSVARVALSLWRVAIDTIRALLADRLALSAVSIRDAYAEASLGNPLSGAPGGRTLWLVPSHVDVADMPCRHCA
jgi:hypothetical protein